GLGIRKLSDDPHRGYPHRAHSPKARAGPRGASLFPNGAWHWVQICRLIFLAAGERWKCVTRGRTLAQNNWTPALSSLLNGQSKRRTFLWMNSRKKFVRSRKSWRSCVASNRSFSGAFLKRLRFSAGFALPGNSARVGSRLPARYFQFATFPEISSK